MTEKFRLREAVIVEGRYDKIKLSALISTPVIETGGFRVFSDKEKQELIRAIAERRGILVMTDVDSAGFVIRNFLRGIVPPEQIKHAYIPTVEGKEKRKSEPSKEGTLGVEGISVDALRESILKSGATIIAGDEIAPIENRESDKNTITKLDFFEYGLTGSSNSSEYRERILGALGLPKYMTTNAMIAAVNCLFTKEEFESYISQNLLQ